MQVEKVKYKAKENKISKGDSTMIITIYDGADTICGSKIHIKENEWAFLGLWNEKAVVLQNGDNLEV